MSFLLSGRRVDAIPDSVVAQWEMAEGAGDIFADAVGSADGSLVGGADWESDSDAVGGFVTTYDGERDTHGVVDQSDTTELGDSGTLLITTEVRDTSSFPQVIWHHRESSDTDDRLYVRFEDTSEIRVGIVGEVPLHSYPLTSDTKIRVGLRWDNGSYTLFAGDEGDSSSTEIGSGAYSGSVTTTNSDWYFGAQDVGASGGSDNNLAGALDNPILFDEPLSDSDIEDDFTGQPWS